MDLRLSEDNNPTQYPEVLQLRDDGKDPTNLIAVAFPGGGSRAFSCGIGVLRALRHLQVADKAHFFTSVSGGAWFAVPYIFSPRDDDELLGKYSDPTAMTQPRDENERGIMCTFPGRQEASDSRLWVRFLKYLGYDPFLVDFAALLFAPTAKQDDDGWLAWQKLVASRYIQPAGLDPETLLGYPGCDDDETFKRVAGTRSFVKPRANMPIALVNATVQGPKDEAPQKADNTAQFPPLVISAYAAGSYMKKTEVKYQFRPDLFRRGTELTIWLGGVVVPGAALGTKSNSDQQDDTSFDLADALTVTSLAYATAINQLGDYGLLNAVAVLSRYQRLSMTKLMHYWMSNEATKPAFRQFDLGDGGNNADNAGLIAALQRGVRSIFFYVPTTLNFNTNAKFDNEGDFDWQAANIDIYLAAYFGYAQQSRSLINLYGWNLSNIHIFKRNDFKVLLDKLKLNFAEKNSLAAVVETTTVNNPVMGVSAGNLVRLTVVIQHKPDWFDNLPEKTKKDLGREFPYYENSRQTLTPVQCDQLANLAAWSILQHEDIVSKAFDPGAW